MPKQKQQGQFQPLSAPGVIRRPEIRNTTPRIIVNVFIVCWLLLVILLTCIFFSTPTFGGSTSPELGAGALITLFGLLLFGPIIILIVLLVARSTKKEPRAMLEEAQRQVAAQEGQLRSHAYMAVMQAPAQSGGHAVIGAAIMGTLPWGHGPWAVLPQAELAMQGIVIGRSGSGKTMSLLRLAYVAATVYGYRVYYLDAKGDYNTAISFVAIMRQAGRNPRLFPHEAFNGWQGDGNALLNRLMAVENFSEPYYRTATRRVLSLLCGDQAGPPRNSQAFFRRFDDPLKARANLAPRDLTGIELRYRAFFEALAGKLDAGWSWENTDAGYISLDSLSLREEAASLGRYLVEDFAHYATTRKRPGHDLLIIDEYSTLMMNGADTANLIERLRSHDCAVILASQSYASLGPEQDAERILDVANWLLVHCTAAPERLARRAGTLKQVQHAYQFGGPLKYDVTDRGVISENEEPEIHPDRVRGLQTGEALIIAHGRSLQACMALAPGINELALKEARAWLATLPPAPPPNTP